MTAGDNYSFIGLWHENFYLVRKGVNALWGKSSTNKSFQVGENEQMFN